MLTRQDSIKWMKSKIDFFSGRHFKKLNDTTSGFDVWCPTFNFF